MKKSDPIRDPEELSYADHLSRRMRERNIGAHEVRKAIREGSIEDGSKPSDIRYRLEIPGVDLLVVADTRNDKVTTAFFDDEQGAEGGKI